MRIRIQQLKLMRIHADPDLDTDPDPKPWYKVNMVRGVKVTGVNKRVEIN